MGQRRTLSLKPRARLLRTLGDELISSDIVALVELVKNSYDADASRVVISFNPPLEEGKGEIQVLDDGHGMSLETIQSAWMEPATSYRAQRKKSLSGRRRVLGEKGIGRFAASRLASSLEVVTRGTESSQEIHVLFDWTDFDAPDKYLEDVDAEWWSTEPSVFNPHGDALRDLPEARSSPTGTLLKMVGLRHAWGRSEFADLRVRLARLVSPSHVRVKQEGRFSIFLDLPSEFRDLAGKVESPEALLSPRYILTGKVQKSGKYRFTIKVPTRGIEEIREGTLGREQASYLAGPLQIELRAWDREADALRQLADERDSTLHDIQRDLNSVAGINLYRDGFRVFPYGEPQNDWLRLDIRRVQNPTLRLSNNQIAGYVFISADSNPDLRDQSNREGLIENPAVEDLREAVIMALNELEQIRYRLRPRESERRGLFATDVNRLVAAVRERHPEDKRLLSTITRTVEEIGREREQAQEVIARYRRLATLGQLVDTILHDGRAPVGKISTEAELGVKDIRSNRNGSLLPGLKDRFRFIIAEAEVLATTFRKIEPFGGRRRGRPKAVALEQIISDAFRVFETEVQDLGVDVSLPQGKTMVTVDQAELQQVFINLLQNSLYWLKKVNKESRKIVVRLRRLAGGVRIVFSDSGPGVDEQVADEIFEPYFSTKPRGVGLGLAIAGEIVTEYYAGSLELVGGPLEGASFAITLRRRI